MNTKKIFILSAVCLDISVVDVSALILRAISKSAKLEVYAYTVCRIKVTVLQEKCIS